MLWASCTIARTMLASSSDTERSWMKDRSTFSMSTGRCFRRPSDECPVPKSSSAIRRPRMWSSPRIRFVRSGSVIAVDSVISTITVSGGMEDPSSTSSTRSARCGCQSCRGERLKLTSISSPCARDSVLAGELGDDPIPYRLDHTHLLGERDELARRDQPAVRVAPADERLSAASLAGREVQDRLVVQDPPLLLHRLAQPRPERELRERVGRGVGEDDVAARPPVLALIHGCVGVLEEILAVRRVARVEADP